jgi:hypothetical protein
MTKGKTKKYKCEVCPDDKRILGGLCTHEHRVSQGKPPTIEDPEILELLRWILRPDPPRQQNRVQNKCITLDIHPL